MFTERRSSPQQRTGGSMIVSPKRIGGSCAVVAAQRTRRVGGSCAVVAGGHRGAQKVCSPMAAAARGKPLLFGNGRSETQVLPFQCCRSKSDEKGFFFISDVLGITKPKFETVVDDAAAVKLDGGATDGGQHTMSLASATTHRGGSKFAGSPLACEDDSTWEDGFSLDHGFSPDHAFMGAPAGTPRMSAGRLEKSSKWNVCDRNDVSMPFISLAGAGYRITREQELGHGAQGIVKLGQNAVGAQRSIKCVPKKDLAEHTLGALKEALKDEFRYMRKLDSRFIARVFELFQDQDFCYMIGEPYFGGDFCTLIPRAEEHKVPMVEEWWRSLIRQCFEGLAYLHEQGLMHCDIKEPNLMLRHPNLRNPQVVIIDLGLALPIGSEPGAKKRGTMGYIPPETYQTQQWYPEGDVFSMGVVVAQLLLYAVPISPSRGSVRCGAFTAGVHTSGEIRKVTMTRDLNFLVSETLPPEYSGLVSLMPKITAKDIKERSGAQQVLGEPWFSQPQLSSVEFNPHIAKMNRQLKRSEKEQEKQLQLLLGEQLPVQQPLWSSPPQKTVQGLAKVNSRTFLSLSQVRLMQQAAFYGRTLQPASFLTHPNPGPISPTGERAVIN